MQLKQLSPVAAAILAALLSACGGGGDDAPPPAAAPAPVLKVSAVALSSANTKVYAKTPVTFNGGVCSEGTGALTTTWDFGDSTSTSTVGTHTYETEGEKNIKVTCTDSTGATKEAKLKVTVLAAAMQGFLGKSWTNYARIDPSNISPYPVAALAADSGDVYGVWLRRVAGNIEAAAGTTNLTSTSWTVSGTLATGADQSPFDDTIGGKQIAMIDLAVSPNGHGMVAWKAGTSLWYATKNSLGEAWSTPAPIPGETVLNGSPIKVVVNNSGHGAIGYCSSATDARVIGYTHTPTPAIQTSVQISTKCGELDNTLSAFQRHRGFDLAIDATSSKVYVVGINAGTTDTTKWVVGFNSVSGGTLDNLIATPVSDELATADAPASLSYSRSPNGNRGVIAWNQVTSTLSTKSNVYTSIWNGTSWGTKAAVQNDFTTKDYSRPLIAMNDDGDAFLAMQLKNTANKIQTEVSNYDASANPPTWSWPKQISETGFYTTDIAIDNWGTGLVTSSDLEGWYTSAGTFAKKAGTTQWSGFTKLSPILGYYPGNYPYNTFHHQTMRALPDGRAILVTSIYDDQTPLTASKQPIPSGYMFLK